MLRLSVHDPILPLNIENDVAGTAAKVADEIAQFLTRFDKLDLSGFKKKRRPVCCNLFLADPGMAKPNI